MKRNLVIALLVVSLLLVFTGSLFKILHWPFADVLQLVGMLAGVVGVGMLLAKIWSKSTR